MVLHVGEYWLPASVIQARKGEDGDTNRKEERPVAAGAEAAINGGCGGPTTNEWYLSSNGWVSHSITTSAS